MGSIPCLAVWTTTSPVFITTFCILTPQAGNFLELPFLQGRTLVYWTVYSLDATRCIILHLAATQSLQHAAGYSSSCTLCAGIVAVIALAVSQVPSPALPAARTDSFYCRQ